jgi:hypothetical protein
MGRLERWKTKKVFSIAFSNPQSNPELMALRNRAPKRAGRAGGLTANIVGLSREAVLSVEDGKPILTFVTFSFDAEYMDVFLAPDWQLIDTDDEDLKTQLALCLVEEVPVYPKDADAAVLLERLHAELLTEGFAIRDQGGGRKRYKISSAHHRAVNVGATQPDWSYEPSASVSPADLLLIRKLARKQLEDNAEAARALASLRASIDQLDALLTRVRPATRVSSRSVSPHIRSYLDLNTDEFCLSTRLERTFRWITRLSGTRV